jgi:DNA-binding NarL/FixJ family response regulator
MAIRMMSRPTTSVLLFDEGQASNLDALAASVSIFGAGRFELLYASDLDSLRQMAVELAALDAAALVVVDADHEREPKELLATAANMGFPLVVLSDGRDDAIHDHALSVGAAAYLLSELPARALVDSLDALSGKCDGPGAN